MVILQSGGGSNLIYCREVLNHSPEVGRHIPSVERVVPGLVVVDFLDGHELRRRSVLAVSHTKEKG